MVNYIGEKCGVTQTLNSCRESKELFSTVPINIQWTTYHDVYYKLYNILKVGFL